MTSTIDQPGPFDALRKARPGEPIFTLLGRDDLAPKLVSEWAWQNRDRALKLEDDDKRKLELDQSTEAEEIAWAMDAYRKGEADAPPSRAADAEAYSGFVPSEEMIADAERIRKLNMIQTAVSEAAAQVQTALELLDGMNRPHELLHDITRRKMVGTRDYLTQLALGLMPARVAGR